MNSELLQVEHEQSEQKIDGKHMLDTLEAEKSVECLYSSGESSGAGCGGVGGGSLSSIAKSSNNLTMYKKKTAARHPGMVVHPVSEVRQRVISAKINRVKTLQNQLTEAQQHISELLTENRLLRTIHKRQDSALSKYESSNAELPQLLHSHSEEVRVWQTRCRNIQMHNKDLANKLKQRDAALLQMNDQNRHLIYLNNNKHLEERDKLTDRVQYLELRITEKDEEMKVLLRRLQLDAKSYKSQIANEHTKYKELLKQMEQNHGTSAEGSSRVDVAGRKAGLFGSRAASSSVRSSKVSLIPTSAAAPGRGGLHRKYFTPRIANGSLSPSVNSNYSENDNFLKKLSPTPPIQNGIMPKNIIKEQLNSPVNFKDDNDDDSVKRLHFFNRGERTNGDKSEISSSIRNGTSNFKDIIYEDKKVDLNELVVTKSNLPSDNDSSGTNYSKEQFELDDEDEEEQNINDKADDDADVDYGGAAGDFSNLNLDESDQSDAETLIQNEDNLNNKNDMEALIDDMQQGILKSESFLDSLCDSVTNDVELFEPKPKSISTITNRDKMNLKNNRSIDPKKKTKLLAALRAIDSNDSFDK